VVFSEEKEIIQWLQELTWDDIPEAVKEHTLMSILNYIGVGVNGANSVPAQMALDILGSKTGPALILGQSRTTDRYTSALVNGIAAHVDDFDDTHLQTVIHPCAPVISSVIPLLTERTYDGPEFLLAVAVGCEVTLRLGMSVSPQHYDEGWHITSTCGAIGAAVACSKLLSVPPNVLSAGMSEAGRHVSGLQASFGSMTKSLHAGVAAQNGLFSTELAVAGLCHEPFSTTRSGSFMAVWGSKFDPSYLNFSTSAAWELLDNSFKPYPCGVVAHPVIDAGIRLHDAVDTNQIEAITVYVNPLVLELTNQRNPSTGLEGKFSVVYCLASAVLDGFLSVDHFTDEMVARPDVVLIQRHISVVADENVARDGCYLAATLSSAETKQITVRRATGSRHNPMKLETLLEKSRRLIDPILGIGRTMELWDELHKILHGGTLSNFVNLLTKQGEYNVTF